MLVRKTREGKMTIKFRALEVETTFLYMNIYMNTLQKLSSNSALYWLWRCQYKFSLEPDTHAIVSHNLIWSLRIPSYRTSTWRHNRNYLQNQLFIDFEDANINFQFNLIPTHLYHIIKLRTFILFCWIRLVCTRPYLT